MEKYTIGLQLLIIGMGTVLLALFLLSLFLRFSGKIMGPGKEKESKVVKKESKVGSEKSNVESTEVVKGGLTPAKKAAITAAIYQMLDGGKYNIISIRRTENNW